MTDKIPRTCLLTVTNRCVLRCKMCNLWQLDTADCEINIADCKKFTDSLNDFGSEPFEIHLIGGEPLIKKGILELISHLSSRGSRTVMTSCGYTIDKNLAKAIVDSGLSVLNLSLDSMDPAVHNFLRGKEDSLQRVMDAINYCGSFKKDRFKLGINTVMSAANLDTIEELTEWVNSNEVLDSIYFMAVMRPFGASVDWQWYEKDEYHFLWPKDSAKLGSILDKLIALKHKGYKIENPTGQLEAFKSYFRDPKKFIKVHRCSLTHQAININALGDAYICFFMDALGNIKVDNIKKLWYSEKAEYIRSKMVNCRKNCELIVNCYYGE